MEVLGRADVKAGTDWEWWQGEMGSSPDNARFTTDPEH